MGLYGCNRNYIKRYLLKCFFVIISKLLIILSKYSIITTKVLEIKGVTKMSDNPKLIMSMKTFKRITSISSSLGFIVTLVLYIMNIGFGLVNGVSMFPTFNDKDIVVVSTDGPGSIDYDDIIIFFPQDENEKAIRNGFDYIKRNKIDKEVVFIKRVIGLPGDTIEVRDGYVWRNGEKLECPYTANKTYGMDEPYVVEEDRVFCLGDNREYSADSRVFGSFPMSGVVGKIILHS